MAKASSEILYSNRGEVIEPSLFEVHEGEVPWWEIDDCKERKKAYRQQWQRVRDRLHPRARAEERERHKEGHPGVYAEATRRHEERHPGAAAEARKKYKERYPGVYAEAQRRYYKTPKGRANLAKGTAERRGRSTDPDAYAARVELLHIIQEPCTECGALYTTTHQVDHILALCLGGTDDWSNLQPLCIKCHRKKTKEDMRRFASNFLQEDNAGGKVTITALAGVTKGVRQD